MVAGSFFLFTIVGIVIRNQIVYYFLMSHWINDLLFVEKIATIDETFLVANIVARGHLVCPHNHI